jgi:hypothetical protein
MPFFSRTERTVKNKTLFHKRSHITLSICYIMIQCTTGTNMKCPNLEFIEIKLLNNVMLKRVYYYCTVASLLRNYALLLPEFT